MVAMHSLRIRRISPEGSRTRTNSPSLIINSVDIDEDYIYFATTSGGILRYNKYRDYWDYPYTTSNGLSSNKIRQIVYSYDDGFLYAQTPLGIDVYKRAQNYWQPSDKNRLPDCRGVTTI